MWCTNRIAKRVGSDFQSVALPTELGWQYGLFIRTKSVILLDHAFGFDFISLSAPDNIETF